MFHLSIVKIIMFKSIETLKSKHHSPQMQFGKQWLAFIFSSVSSGLETHQTFRYVSETRETSVSDAPHHGLSNEARLLMTQSHQQETMMASSGVYLIGSLCSVVTLLTFRSPHIRMQENPSVLITKRIE